MLYPNKKVWSFFYLIFTFLFECNLVVFFFFFFFFLFFYFFFFFESQQ